MFQIQLKNDKITFSEKGTFLVRKKRDKIKPKQDISLIDVYLQSTFPIGRLAETFHNFPIDTQTQYTPRNAIIITNRVLLRLEVSGLKISHHLRKMRINCDKTCVTHVQTGIILRTAKCKLLLLCLCVALAIIGSDGKIYI